MEVVLLASDKRRKIKTSVLSVRTFLHTIISQFWEHMRQVLNWPPCELLATTHLIHAVACGVWTWCLEFGPIYRRCQYLWHPATVVSSRFPSSTFCKPVFDMRIAWQPSRDRKMKRWVFCSVMLLCAEVSPLHFPVQSCTEYFAFVFFLVFFFLRVDSVSHCSCICVSVFLIYTNFSLLCVDVDPRVSPSALTIDVMHQVFEAQQTGATETLGNEPIWYFVVAPSEFFNIYWWDITSKDWKTASKAEWWLLCMAHWLSRSCTDVSKVAKFFFHDIHYETELKQRCEPRVICRCSEHSCIATQVHTGTHRYTQQYRYTGT